MKSSIMKMATLEQELASEKNAKKILEVEYTSFKEKQSIEIRVGVLYDFQLSLLYNNITNQLMVFIFLHQIIFKSKNSNSNWA
jgi:hypothetical protein